ncbi:ribosomal protein S3 [Methanobacterium paludis]|uniref:Small ribosomal subunit protein uS3 n=1 Tax=Methanobacterium paludis (strain DSM 25820 / JCM 18151 / SWAN1) TaxID=868131 RepID=F6D7L2_METPW|nr:ribosomal protein S3 [Methanobacterium paludis]
MIEKDFVTEGLKRTRIDEYLETQLERAGYGGMEIQVTPLGTMVVVYAERPGMVIGRGGKTVRSITQNLKNDYGLENPQVEVKEVEVPELNPKIMAHKIANMLQRGMHFRRVAYTALRRIMGAGAQGVEVTISGKIRGSRSACSKFTDGYIKKCGEPANKHVRKGFATVQLKPGVLGIYVRIMPPGILLPDKVDIKDIEIEEPAVEKVVENIEKEEAPKSAEKVEVVEEAVKPEDILEEITEEKAEDIEEVPEEVPEESVEEAVEPEEEAAKPDEKTSEEPVESKDDETSPKDTDKSEAAESEDKSKTEEKADKSE